MNLLLRIYRKFERPERFYEIDGFMMDLGKDHKLSLLQKYNPMYDRFIKFLGGGMDSNQYFIDIGANVGDTAAAIMKHTNGNIVCVEPSEKYFGLLEKNVSNFPVKLQKRIIVEKAIISDRKQNYMLHNHGHGTGYVVETDEAGSVPVLTIPELLAKHNIELSKVCIIKTDTDGLDAACIMSMGDSLNNIHPIFYFENLVHNQKEFDEYAKLYDYLNSHGYCCFYIFDNFGNFICTANEKNIKEFLAYHYSTRMGKSYQTIAYYDIMACTENGKSRCDCMITKYLKKYR